MRAHVARALRDLASYTHPQLAPECLHISSAIPIPTNARLIWNEAGRADSAVQDHFYDSTVEKYALQEVEALSLQQMLEFGRAALFDDSKILSSARHVQKELPKRLARRLMDLQFLPHIVVTNPYIKRVYNAYHHAFNTLRQMPMVQSREENAVLTSVLQRLVDEHAPMLDALAAGFKECKLKPIVGPKLQLDAFLDGMLRSRISRRIMAEQHICLAHRRPGFVGIICAEMSLVDAVRHAALRTKQICTETFGAAPDVVISSSGAQTVKMPYIPTHLDYMLFELFKNAMRAVVDSHDGRRVMPAIHLAICPALNSVTLRISDQGGGIPENSLEQVFQYGYTTVSDGSLAPQVADDGAMWAQMSERAASPGGPWRMGGLGFGLPLSRLYARYFGGDLRLVSMPGYGVDCYLSIPYLEGQWEETRVEPHADATSNGEDAVALP